MQEHHLLVRRTARYYSLGSITPDTEYVWIACHGYGQLARRFLRKFDFLSDTGHYILAPEGLSRFYWQGLTGEVAASWMTKDDRLHEIQDFCNYLDTLLEKTLQDFDRPPKLVLFGFSQGCATIIRWMMDRFPKVHRAILWAGLFPEDINYLPHQEYLRDTHFHFIYGTEDQYLTPEREAIHRKLLADQQLKVQIHSFKGPHQVDRQVLMDFVQEYLV